MNTASVSTGTCPVLPADVWTHIVDAIVASDSYHGRWRDLAHLAWTCRDAYMAARRPLWQHLRLVFRINAEDILAPDGDLGHANPVTRHQQHLAFQHHQSVLESSVFPRYSTGQLALESERLKRIRQVSHSYPHLQPFVVLDGNLYLASRLENEWNPRQPDFSGIPSLWGAEEGSSLSTGARIVGDLVLVPYPLQLVNELTIDALGSADDIGDCPLTRTSLHVESELGFIFRLDPHQVQTLHFYVDAGQGAWSIYNPIGLHLSSISNHEYFLAGGEHYCPAFGQSTRHVQLFHGESFDSDRDVIVTLSSLPIVTFEQYGSGCFDLRFGASALMLSPTLTQLVLDYDLHASGNHEPIEMHLPALKQLSITFQVAEMLFDSGFSDIMFPMLDAPSPTALNKRHIFPALTHLTLLDVEHDGAGDRAAGDLVYVPWVPYHHMPRLSHFCIPSVHRVALFSHSLQSLVAVNLASITPAASDPEVSDPPFAAPYLTHVETTLVAAYNLPAFINSTPELTSTKLDIQDNCLELAFFTHTPKLTRLHLDGREFHPDWWSILARNLPQLTHLTIHDTEDEDQVGAKYTVEVDSTTNAYPCFPNLERLSFTMTNGTFDFTGLDLPRLKHLVVNTEHPRTFPSVYPHLESLNLTGALCPVQVIRLLDDLPAQCRVKIAPSPTEKDLQLCGVFQLRMRFAGAQNQRVWRELLCAAPFTKQDGLIKESVTVVLDRSPTARPMVGDGDAQLIAKVLAHLLSKQAAASIECFVTCDSSLGESPTAEDVQGGNAVARAMRIRGLRLCRRSSFDDVDS
ncbi:hypothetical protein BCR44DRAFT_1426631 [Catenaria anguillulae PL171]|uniref:Uncharacterized protein n=1 Tax=Catenaria anguillulae PL171 TaxID=765915 RepID=A0A1Y2HY48_9FUNG|nr:hypothetical protein BCR44DRAFT_1426631 [Catenaria anguillulae PL171]